MRSEFIVCIIFALSAVFAISTSQTFAQSPAAAADVVPGFSREALAGNERLLLGGQLGIPILVAARAHLFFRRSEDGMPVFYLTGTAGFSLGLGASIAISQRIAQSDIYPMLGLHCLYLNLLVLSEVRWLSPQIGVNFNSLRGTTFKQVTVGILIGRIKNRDRLTVYPVLSVSWANPL
jgi:hypothetical protein